LPIPPRVLAFSTALLLAAELFRARLAWLAAQALTEAGAHDPWQDALILALQPAWRDPVLALALGLLAAAVMALPARKWLSGLVIATTLILLLATGMLAATHLRLLFSLHAGLTWDLLRDAWASGEWRALLEHTHAIDIATVLVWPLAWLGLRRVPSSRVRWLAAALLLLTLPGAILPRLTTAQRHDMPEEAGVSPLWLWSGVAEALRPHGQDLGEEPPRHKQRVVQARPVANRLVDPALAVTATDVPGETALFLDDPRISEPGPMVKVTPPMVKRWNVVWIVMESTGMRYFQGETYHGVLPMPFTHHLADQGWFLSHHRSPSNSSATSIFAQFSGLYPVPALKMFSTDKQNFVPALFRFLPPTYERFLFTPGKLTYFFPKPFLQHAGLTEMVGFDETEVTKNPGGEGLSKDEPAVVDNFTQRLHRAHEPFAAVYYSYLAHWEYTDYGPQWHHFHDPRLIGRYHDNLWLLDHLIERIYRQLEADGRLDRTLIVLAGDHGESFGQHERNWAHARGSFEENLGTPAILWQPKVFQPRVDERETLHIDLLPTVLDALGLPYDPQLLQGESLFQAKLRRKVAFFWGNEGTVTGVWPDGAKLQWQVLDKRCTTI
jgi:hypothetical protein